MRILGLETGCNVQGSGFQASSGAGLPCSTDQSLCNGRNEMCIGRGPAYEADDQGFKSNEIIAGKQFHKAKDLWHGDLTPLSGNILHKIVAYF